jgi:hypothetical protein
MPPLSCCSISETKDFINPKHKIVVYNVLVVLQIWTKIFWVVLRINQVRGKNDIRTMWKKFTVCNLVIYHVGRNFVNGF